MRVEYSIKSEDVEKYEKLEKELKKLESKEDEIRADETRRKRPPLYQASEDLRFISIDGSVEEIKAAQKAYKDLLADRYSEHGAWVKQVGDLRYDLACLRGGLLAELNPKIQETIVAVEKTRHAHRIPSERTGEYKFVTTYIDRQGGRPREVDKWVIKWNFPLIDVALGKLQDLRRDIQTLPLSQFESRIRETNRYFLTEFDPKQLTDYAVSQFEWEQILEVLHKFDVIPVITSQNLMKSGEVCDIPAPPSSPRHKELFDKWLKDRGK